MSDVVVRLREFNAKICQEAADEIERLRTALSAIVEERDKNLYLQDYLDDELINRARAALTPR